MSDEALFDVQPAVRAGSHVLIGLAGLSGSGKTYSALLLARGLVGPDGKIGVVDAEAKRASLYSGIAGGFEVCNLEPPFTPERYVTAIKSLQAKGCDVVIIDSTSHEWEGTGGCIEMAEGKMGLQAWHKPKVRHKKFLNYVLQTDVHIIFCVRAREKYVQVPDPSKPGKDMIVSKGIQPVQERDFIYEMTVTCILDETTKVPELRKCPDDLAGAFPAGQKISVNTGEMIAEWVGGGVPVDHAAEAVKSEARDVASMGVESFRRYWSTLERDKRAIIKPMMADLKSAAEEADAQAARVDEEGPDESALDDGPPAESPPPNNGNGRGDALDDEAPF